MQLHKQYAALLFAMLLCFMSMTAYAGENPDILEENFITVSVNNDNAVAYETGDKGTAVSLGGKVNFRLTSRVPAMDDFDSYTYVVHSTLSNGLTLHETDNVKVTIDSAPYTDFSVKQAGQSFSIAFQNFTARKHMAGKEIVITYSAILNEKALATDRETNTVNLEYSVNPDDKKTGFTADKTVYVYDFDIAIDIYTGNADSGTRLPDAMFVLRNSGGDYYQYKDAATKNAKVVWVPIDSRDIPDTKDMTMYQIKKAWENLGATVVVTDKNGAAKFQGLESGSYALKEIAAPAGYHQLASDIPVAVTVAYRYDGTLKNSASSAKSTRKGQYCQMQRIKNRSCSILSAASSMAVAVFLAVLLAAVLILLLLFRASCAGTHKKRERKDS